MAQISKPKNWVYRREFNSPKCIIAVELAHNMAIIHCDFSEKWSKANYYKSIHIWLVVARELLNIGLHDVYAPVKDETTATFASMFGFYETDLVADIGEIGICPLWAYDLREVM